MSFEFLLKLVGHASVSRKGVMADLLDEGSRRGWHLAKVEDRLDILDATRQEVIASVFADENGVLIAVHQGTRTQRDETVQNLVSVFAELGYCGTVEEMP